eukprot:TRINITY_DN1928_c0_g1_i1.p1 TRINITY_DN1928_c0_g1~~TRINITY_DN1928_c0_g1_i1.p1  ORF type:complete len:884 (+),score=230.17 TRINITY_DN1928_c0_g1_i1:301-2952(+)
MLLAQMEERRKKRDQSATERKSKVVKKASSKRDIDSSSAKSPRSKGKTDKEKDRKERKDKESKSHVSQEEKLREQQERDYLTDRRRAAAERQLAEEEERRQRREAYENSMREEADRAFTTEEWRLKREAEELARYEHAKLVEKKRILEEMKKAEEALEARERERKEQAERAKQTQQQKQNAFRRSVMLRQEELQRDAEKISKETNPADKRKSLLMYANQRASRRLSTTTMQMEKDLKRKPISPDVFPAIEKQKNVIQVIVKLLGWICENPLEQKVTDSTNQIISSVTNILQTVKALAEKLRVPSEEFPPTIVSGMRSTGVAAKAYLNACSGATAAERQRTIPQASLNLKTEVLGIFTALVNFYKQRQEEEEVAAQLLATFGAAAGGGRRGTTKAAEVAQPVVPQATRVATQATRAPEPAPPPIAEPVIRRGEFMKRSVSELTMSAPPTSSPERTPGAEMKSPRRGAMDITRAASNREMKHALGKSRLNNTASAATTPTPAPAPTPVASTPSPPPAAVSAIPPPPSMRGGGPPPPPPGMGPPPPSMLAGRGGPPPPPPIANFLNKKDEDTDWMSGPPSDSDASTLLASLNDLPPPPPPEPEDDEEDDGHEFGPLPADYVPPERPSEVAADLDLTNPAHAAILAYIETLEEEYENLSRKANQKDKTIANLKAQVIAGGGGALLGMSYKEVQKKLAELQARLFAEDIDPAEAQTLNVEYEKMTNEMEKMPEFIAEQKKAEERWKRENYEANKEAYGRVMSLLQKMPAARRDATLKKEPCLVLLGLSPDRIKKKHKNDWRTVSPHNLNLEQARAIYFCLPEFRPDQEEQCRFVDGLKQKIDDLKKKTPPPKPITATRKVVIPKTAPGAGAGPGGFLEELLRKRKKIG